MSTCQSSHPLPPPPRLPNLLPPLSPPGPHLPVLATGTLVVTEAVTCRLGRGDEGQWAGPHATNCQHCRSSSSQPWQPDCGHTLQGAAQRPHHTPRPVSIHHLSYQSIMQEVLSRGYAHIRVHKTPRTLMIFQSQACGHNMLHIQQCCCTGATSAFSA